MDLHRYFLHLSYDGSAYHGWQVQPNATTVQYVIESALSLILSTDIQITGAGRTDTGVHARNYYAHFDALLNFSDTDLKQLVYKLNSILPGDIYVYSAFEVIPETHARFSAVSRTYRYYISRRKDPFQSLYSWQYKGKLDIDKMSASASKLKSYSDFGCFSKTGTDNSTNLCSITESYFVEKDDLLIYHVTANRFLRNMVRAIVGTLVDIGKGKFNPEELDQLILSGNRSYAGESVPARGLFLEEVTYPSGIRLTGK
ncbi:MAG: tRNA pseudouridine(38-40) synthase TruA [Lentimicrobium sp.]|nr:tRNA pseudouridine(38-40) synthase TruA [Lentimicrobium sp.]